MSVFQPLEIGKEYPLPGEAETIQEIANISERQLRFRYSNDEPSNDQKPIARRDQHLKHHGVVWANFTINANIPSPLQQGVFSKPGDTYSAWIRYSNGQGKDDSKSGSQGMAIKLLGVEGTQALGSQASTQDFVMIDHPVFFIRNIPDYLEVFTALEDIILNPGHKKGGPLAALKPFFFPSLSPTSWRLKEFKEFLILGLVKKKIKLSSPLQSDYFSVTPYKLGDGKAIKFHVKPHAQNKPGKVNKKDPNYLRNALTETLTQRSAGFDFYIQEQTDATKMPVEDSTVEWKSPFFHVATIEIPQQIFDSPEQMEFGENLSFTPWHTLEVHQPLGSMNRTRKVVYQHTAQVRRELNHAVLDEPTIDSFSPTLL